MDEFEYQMAIAEINSAKYVKDIEALLRKYVPALSGKYYSYEVAKKDHQSQILIFKVASRAYQKFKSKSKATLPEFVLNALEYNQINITTAIFKGNIPGEYEDLINYFEFSDSVTCAKYRVTNFQKLHAVIQNKPINFKLVVNDILSKFELNTVEQSRRLIKAIRLKQTLSPNTPSTILDKELEYQQLHASQESRESIDADIQLMEEQLIAMKYYRTTHTKWEG